MQPTDLLKEAVADLSERTGYRFVISDEPVPGTTMFVVYTENHPFRPEYTVPSGILGFRVPSNFPDAGPEDSFFIAPVTTKLVVPDPIRRNADLNRAGVAPTGYLAGSTLNDLQVLVFSWHLWNTRPWNRRTNTLTDHYTHSIRRFELPEHD